LRPLAAGTHAPVLLFAPRDLAKIKPVEQDGAHAASRPQRARLLRVRARLPGGIRHAFSVQPAGDLHPALTIARHLEDALNHRGDDGPLVVVAVAVERHALAVGRPDLDAVVFELADLSGAIAAVAEQTILVTDHEALEGAGLGRGAQPHPRLALVPVSRADCI